MRKAAMLLPLRWPTRITDILRSQEEVSEATMGLRRERTFRSKIRPQMEQ
jgi:hypothetical protein